MLARSWWAWVAALSALILLLVFSPVLWSVVETRKSAYGFFAEAKAGRSLFQILEVYPEWIQLRLGDCGYFIRKDGLLTWTHPLKTAVLERFEDALPELAALNCFSGGSVRYSGGYSYYATVHFALDPQANVTSALPPAYQD